MRKLTFLIICIGVFFAGGVTNDSWAAPKADTEEGVLSRLPKPPTGKLPGNQNPASCEYDGQLEFTIALLATEHAHFWFSETDKNLAKAIVQGWYLKLGPVAQSRPQGYLNVNYKTVESALINLHGALDSTMTFREMITTQNAQGNEDIKSALSDLGTAGLYLGFLDIPAGNEPTIIALLTDYLPDFKRKGEAGVETSGLGNATLRQLYKSPADGGDTGVADRTVELVIRAQNIGFLLMPPCYGVAAINQCCCNNPGHTGYYRKCGQQLGANCNTCGGSCCLAGVTWCAAGHTTH